MTRNIILAAVLAIALGEFLSMSFSMRSQAASMHDMAYALDREQRDQR